MMSSFSAMMETEFWGPGSKSMLELRPGKERQYWQEEEEKVSGGLLVTFMNQKGQVEGE